MDHCILLTLRGWVPVNATSGDLPVILTDSMERGSLQGLIDDEKKGLVPPNWDETQKFIVIYGVAIGMMILHGHSRDHRDRIVHRDLKSDNGFLDDKWIRTEFQ
jgi:serine/threonine protein kinase